MSEHFLHVCSGYSIVISAYAGNKSRKSSAQKVIVIACSSPSTEFSILISDYAGTKSRKVMSSLVIA